MSSQGSRLLRLALLLLVGLPLAGVSWAANVNTHAQTSAKSKKISESQRTRRRLRRLARSRSATVRHASVRTRRHRYYERFHMSSFADTVTEGDVTAGEDPIVRPAAGDAVGHMNGTVGAIQAARGRGLAVGDPKLARFSGAH